MAPVGFSTGTLALGNFRVGLQKLQGKDAAAVELSALRDIELEPLVTSLDELDLKQYTYISVHAPSAFVNLSEREVVELLKDVFRRNWPVVVHPDAITNWSLWQEFGPLVCIENMDKRKPIGRTAQELSMVFEKLPDASMCFDIGHARQVDPTMSEAIAILKEHGHRIQQLHVSEVNTASGHEPLNQMAESAFARIAKLIPQGKPIIMETPVDDQWIESEMTRAVGVLSLMTE